MSHIRVVAKFKIREGKTEDFKFAAAACMACSKEKDKYTLQYDIYMNADESEAVLHELYLDSDAMIMHIETLGDLVQGLVDTSEISVELYGSPSQALVDMLGGDSVPIYAFKEGL